MLSRDSVLSPSSHFSLRSHKIPRVLLHTSEAGPPAPGSHRRALNGRGAVCPYLPVLNIGEPQGRLPIAGPGGEGLVAGMAVSLALTCGALGRRQHCNAQPGQVQHNHTKKRGGAAGQA